MTALIVKALGPRTSKTVRLGAGQRDGNIMDKEMRTRSTGPAVGLSDTGIYVRNAMHVAFLASSTIALHTASIAEEVVWCAAAATQQWNTSVHGVDHGR